MQHAPPSAADSHSADQEIPRLLRRPPYTGVDSNPQPHAHLFNIHFYYYPLIQVVFSHPSRPFHLIPIDLTTTASGREYTSC